MNKVNDTPQLSLFSKQQSVVTGTTAQGIIRHLCWEGHRASGASEVRTGRALACGRLLGSGLAGEPESHSPRMAEEGCGHEARLKVN